MKAGSGILHCATLLLLERCHGAQVEAGWWTDLRTGKSTRTGFDGVHKVNIGEKLMLIVSEVAEAMEGHRKDLMDDKLPHWKMLDVELADAVIRIFDLAGGLNIDLAGALVEKMEFNAGRADHKIESRVLPGGKAY